MKRNRLETYTLPALLDVLITMSGCRHPDDFIDDKTAQIKLRRNPTRVEVRWSGPDPDAPGYRTNP